MDSLYYGSHLSPYRPELDSRHSLELSSNLEEGAGTKETPFPLFPSSPRKTQGSFFSYDDSTSWPGGNQSNYVSGLDNSCIESLNSSMCSSTVSQSDVFSLMPITKPYLRPRYSYMDGSPQRRIATDASLTRSWHELDLLRDEVRLPPGENNPNAVAGGKLCFEYMNKGR